MGERAPGKRDTSREFSGEKKGAISSANTIVSCRVCFAALSSWLPRQQRLPRQPAPAADEVEAWLHHGRCKRLTARMLGRGEEDSGQEEEEQVLLGGAVSAAKFQKLERDDPSTAPGRRALGILEACEQTIGGRHFENLVEALVERVKAPSSAFEDALIWKICEDVAWCKTGGVPERKKQGGGKEIEL